jgi:hypothetical protein
VPIIFYILRLYIIFQTPQSSPALATEINKLYANREYALVIDRFKTMTDKSDVISPETRIKAAHAFFAAGDTTSQVAQLKKMENLRNKTYQSVILNQKAILSAYSGDTLTAINLLKKAIETENTNNFVKQNFEYLKKIYHPNKNNNAPNRQNLEQEREQEELSGLVTNSDSKEDKLTSSTLPLISVEQALKLLDAMRANESNKMPVLFGTESDTTDYGNW